MSQIMQPQPFHNLTAIFVGQVEPWYPDNQVVIVIDEWGDLLINGMLVGTVDDAPIRQADSLPVVVESLRSMYSQMTAEYRDGLFLQGAWMPENGHHQVEHLRVHHVMPLSSFQRGHDTVPICLRRQDIEGVIPEGGLEGISRMPSFPFMSVAGVLDPAKLRDVAFDMMVNHLVLKNSHSFWNINAKPHRADGKGGPAWTLWSNDKPLDDEDF